MFKALNIFKKNTAKFPPHPLMGKKVTYMSAQTTRNHSTNQEPRELPTTTGTITGIIDYKTLQVEVNGETGTYTQVAPNFPYYNRTDIPNNPNGEHIILAK